MSGHDPSIEFARCKLFCVSTREMFLPKHLYQSSRASEIYRKKNKQTRNAQALRISAADLTRHDLTFRDVVRVIAIISIIPGVYEVIHYTLYLNVRPLPKCCARTPAKH
jgi:hypothetical protein